MRVPLPRPLALTIGLLLLALPACTGRAAQSTPPPTVLPGTLTLPFWHALPDEEAQVLQGLVDEWATRQSQAVRVELVGARSEEVLQQKLLAAIQSAHPPALAFVQPPDIAAYVAADTLVPLDPKLAELDEAELDDFYPQFLESVRFPSPDGTLYAMPLHRFQTMLFVNRNRIEALGGTLPPSSWEELVRLCGAHMGQGGQSCYNAFPTGPVAVLWVWSQGGTVVDAQGENPTFQGEAGLSVMRWLAELRALEGIHQVPTYEGYLDSFASGRTLFTFDSTEAIPDYEARINSAFDMVVLPPPAADGEPVTVATGGDIALFRAPPEQERLAWSLLHFLTSPEANQRWADAVGAYPVRRSALAAMDAQWPEFSRLRQASEWLPYARSEPLLAAWPQVEQLLAQAMLETINGQRTPEEALNEAARNAAGLLQEESR